MNGILIKAISGFYYVNTECGLYECKARGVFRKNDISPTVGDRVEISIVSEETKKGSLDKVYERKNCLLRPVIANVDNLIIVSSAKSPDFDYYFVDKLCVICEYYKIRPIIVINKTDLHSGKEFGHIYEKIGYKVIYATKDNEDGTQELKKEISNGINVFGGFSGVGKSTLINSIFGNTDLITGEISKISRGRHTTRHSELFLVEKNTYIADTPGFSSLEIQFQIPNLSSMFIEFNNYSCKYNSCSHTKEISCGIIDAMNKGEISISRYNSYLQIRNMIKDIKAWDN